MRFSTAFPVNLLSEVGATKISLAKKITRALEEAKFDAGYVTDHPIPSTAWLNSGKLGHQSLDPFAALSFLAASCENLLLQTHITVLPYRNPFLTAKAATLHLPEDLIVGAWRQLAGEERQLIFL
jgi:alkanesulfonate monooxygenase SsuD/methylene tetrahydromethanopterin reductase-like flavin-dependent oxidoreductase (luciferase family)